ncbi:hypothetical protein HG531_003884 [Fusarium graminearum]|nr:hypothetical protein HG531_003884 [Fusarium graminearum]
MEPELYLFSFGIEGRYENDGRVAAVGIVQAVPVSLLKGAEGWVIVVNELVEDAIHDTGRAISLASMKLSFCRGFETRFLL